VQVFEFDLVASTIKLLAPGSWSQVLSKKIYLNDKLSEEEKSGIKIVTSIFLIYHFDFI
jgi:23S rRNA U2552 (ribose-2'-O)-methylase RlmE/FtsJ